MKKALKVGIAVVAVAVVVGITLLATSRVVLFRRGFALANADHVRLEVQGDEFDKLDAFTSLSSIEFVGNTDFEAAQAWASAHPNVSVTLTAAPPADTSFDEQTGVVDLTGYGEQEAVQLATSTLRYDDSVRAIKVNPSGWSAESLRALHDACPNASIQGTYVLGALQVPLDAQELDLTQASVDELNAFADVAPCLANLSSVVIGDESGHTKLGAASRIKQASPNANVAYTFTAYGVRMDVNQTRLDFRQVPMGDNGDEVRDLLTNMPQVVDLDMDSTGVDNEHMAIMRNDFPNVNVVWRVWFGPNDVYTARTDVEKILASAEVFGWITPETSQNLNYFNRLKYLDLGHNGSLGNISFVNSMPNLEVFICSLCGISDISPIANCAHMEYFECFGNDISDLSPLANLHELKHLNVVNNLGIYDITPLYGLDLERLWLGGYNQVPQDQIDTFIANHPNCAVRTYVSNPHEDYRWGNPRYDLLNEQLGYTAQDYAISSQDPLLEPRTDIPWADAPQPEAPAPEAEQPADAEQPAPEAPAPEAEGADPVGDDGTASAAV